MKQFIPYSILTHPLPHQHLSDYKMSMTGTSLAVQWLRLCPSTAGGPGSISGGGTKIPHASWHGQKKKKKRYDNTAPKVIVRIKLYLVRTVQQGLPWVQKMVGAELRSHMPCCTAQNKQTKKPLYNISCLVQHFPHCISSKFCIHSRDFGILRTALLNNHCWKQWLLT